MPTHRKKNGSSGEHAANSDRGTRALWSGSISFGLVTIPVELHAAVKEKTVHFHMLHDKDGGRVHQKLVCDKDGREVTRDHVVKGYELSKGKYVEVDAAELRKFMPEKTQRIDISDFVALSEIDPIYYDHTYSLSPGRGGAKAFALLREAMDESERVGIAQVVIRGKQSLCAVRPSGRGLFLSTMHYEDEVLAAPSVPAGKASDKELAMAKQLIDTLSGPFKPAKYHDDYRNKVLALIRKKSKGKLELDQTEDVPAAKQAEVIDLVQALQASLGPKKKRRKAS